MSANITPEWLSLVAGAVLSLLFSYVPGLSDKYGALEPIYKRLVMLGLLALVAVGVFALGCADIVSGVTCDKGGAIELVQAFILAAMANQATYQLSPKSK